MEKRYTIIDVIDKNSIKLEDIIDAGIEAGVELANDDGIDFQVKCILSNGDSSEIDRYKNRLIKNEFSTNDTNIIDKYKDI